MMAHDYQNIATADKQHNAGPVEYGQPKVSLGRALQRLFAGEAAPAPYGGPARNIGEALARAVQGEPVEGDRDARLQELLGELNALLSAEEKADNGR